jgi:hypothetical protein
VDTKEYGELLMEQMLSHAQATLQHAVAIGLDVAHDDDREFVAGSDLAEVLSRVQWERGAGPLPTALEDQRLVYVPCLPEHPEWSWLASAADVPIDTAVVAPGVWRGDAPILVSAYFEADPGATVTSQVDQLGALLANTLAMVEFCTGHEERAQQMVEMMQYRRVIEQVKGMIMAQLRCGPDQAFAVLTRISQHTNIKVRKIAVAIVEALGNGTVEHPDDAPPSMFPTDTDRETVRRAWSQLEAIAQLDSDESPYRR